MFLVIPSILAWNITTGFSDHCVNAVNDASIFSLNVAVIINKNLPLFVAVIINKDLPLSVVVSQMITFWYQIYILN